MKMNKKDWKQYSNVFMTLSVIAVFFSALGYTGIDIWLASTQWLLVSVVLALFGIYSSMK